MKRGRRTCWRGVMMSCNCSGKVLTPLSNMMARSFNDVKTTLLKPSPAIDKGDASSPAQARCFKVVGDTSFAPPPVQKMWERCGKDVGKWWELNTTTSIGSRLRSHCVVKSSVISSREEVNPQSGGKVVGKWWESARREV